jgi:cell division protein ZapE
VPLAAGGVARFQFQDLCGKPLGASDYLALGATFHTILIDGVPLIDVKQHNEARRFITLIDALYESRTKLVLAMAAQPDKLYPTGTGAFEFTRTASRLMEMQSASWIEQPDRLAS